ncbi:hypothetical protein GUJ93_ZPchr0009g875 [Zizania palustris]|uniref:Uncharacterized protein n=1 Tax=Zizania palustris TaxID=103762 RepID=A0A8J5RJZ4_ZIZPA|nr:hypothetical protein GUJ93_ZPchr0009g875 [Zizania palustris]
MDGTLTSPSHGHRLRRSASSPTSLGHLARLQYLAVDLPSPRPRRGVWLRGGGEREETPARSLRARTRPIRRRSDPLSPEAVAHRACA